MKNSQTKILSKKNLLIFAFLLNVAIIVTASFFHYFWVYPVVGAVFALAMVPAIAANNFVTHKMSTLLIMFAFPVFGYSLYMLTKSRSKWLYGRRTWQNLNYNSLQYVMDNDTSLDILKKHDPEAYKISYYYSNYFTATLYQNSSAKYISGAQNYYDSVFAELKDAKKYIFIDAYKIKEGEVWNTLFEILKQKAREGVEIKILYNPKTNKHSFEDKFAYKKLPNFKIEAVPFRSSLYGFSSHRKMFIIDGIVGFVGGANITDSNINLTAEQGNLRQSGIKIVGDAVWNMTVLFLNSWQFARSKNDVNIENYKPETLPKSRPNEFVQPLQISPLANRNEVRDMYLNLIHNAQDHISIVTSCVLIDSVVFKALSDAVKSGVSVNLYVSNFNDAYNQNIYGRGYYESLIRAGIAVLENSSGVNRAKIVSVDGKTALIGGSNLDVRKLEAQFDCSILVHSKDFVKDVDKDILAIAQGSKQLSLKDLKEDTGWNRFKGKIYRFFNM